MPDEKNLDSKASGDHLSEEALRDAKEHQAVSVLARLQALRMAVDTLLHPDDLAELERVLDAARAARAAVDSSTEDPEARTPQENQLRGLELMSEYLRFLRYLVLKLLPEPAATEPPDAEQEETESETPAEAGAQPATSFGDFREEIDKALEPLKEAGLNDDQIGLINADKLSAVFKYMLEKQDRAKSLPVKGTRSLPVKGTRSQSDKDGKSLPVKGTRAEIDVDAAERDAFLDERWRQMARVLRKLADQPVPF